MLKEFLVGAAAIATSVIPLAGVASADDGYGYQGGDDWNQVGLANLNNTDLLHNVNANVGVCDNNINVLGVQVPVENVLNGVGIPIMSPGSSEATGVVPENCASSSIEDGGSIQDN
ncbi:hypothetical protein [Actinophytocola gossypii]|uniref:RdlA protein n=1 Tax=Actinophytocola gossypii TaxID=2812003 RepID=A0ABT2J591_9PSEU|nr:hypothetical protein [Actinophytocola gossypii]MCT2582931.1 hypothetical protein [Actinophytocola gossypii]